jgi:macrolide transport system ATP-binding/permease protein
MLTDLRFTLRQLAKSKTFTLTALLTLGLGIGGNTAIFTLVDAVMLKSLPVADPARLYRLGDADNCCVVGGYQGRFSIYSHGLYQYLNGRLPEFDQMAAFQAGIQSVGVRRPGSSDGPQPFGDQFVSGNYFLMFGIRPFAGRLIAPSDDARSAPPVAVMSYRAWAQHYGSDPAVVGSTFIIDGAPFTIAGIAPPGFFGDTLRPNPPDFWMPLATEPAVHGQNALLDHKDEYWLYIIGRLKEGAAVGTLESHVNVELKRWQLENDPPHSAREKTAFDKQHITIAPAGGGVAQLKDDYARDLKLLMSITALVLLIACANLANLQLARGASNRAQTSIRVALGAPRWRLVRQTLTESIVVAVLGGGVGLLVGANFTGLLMSLVFQGSSFVPIETTPSSLVMGFALLLSLATGILFGVAPAWSASRADPADALRGAGRSGGGRETGLQKSLVVFQAALSLVLMVAAGLMVDTLRNLTNQQFGFHSEGRVVVNVNAAFGGYAPEKITQDYREIDRQLRQLPGVRNVSLSLYSPMEGNNWEMGISIEDHPAPTGQTTSSSWDRVSPSFFDLLGSHILRGRMFDERDTPDSTHVAVVNQAFADKFFANEDPIGKRFGLGGIAHRADYQISGIVENVRFRNPRRPTPAMFFLPLLQMSTADWADQTRARSNIIGNIELHVTGNPQGLAAQVQRTLANIDVNLTVLNLVTMDQQIGYQVGHEKLIARLTELFGILALLLASVGIYGITAYSVARRTSEIGIRTALGAGRRDVIALVLRGALAPIGVGLALGIPAALAAGRILADQVYGVKTYDPWILTGAIVTLVACASIAAYVPAVRASAVDPVRALRME